MGLCKAGGDTCAEMLSNYGYDISSSEEERVPPNQTTTPSTAAIST